MSGSLSLPVRKAVIAGLAEHFNGLSDFEGVQVAFAFDQSSRAAQRIYTARTSFEHEPAGLRSGRVHRDEVGTFDLVVRVELPGCGIEEAEDRADLIQVVCEEWIADHKNAETTDLEGLTALTCRGGSSDHGPIDSGSAALRILNVRWTARLT